MSKRKKNRCIICSGNKEIGLCGYCLSNKKMTNNRQLRTYMKKNVNQYGIVVGRKMKELLGDANDYYK